MSEPRLAELPAERIHREFEAIARAYPKSVAGLHGDRAITYEELDAESNRLARYLSARGVGPEIAVGVCVPPSLDILVALLAILKAGGVYLPLDPTHPPALVAQMLEEAKPAIVLTRGDLAMLSAPWPQLFFDAASRELDACSDAPHAGDARPGDAAYLIYTSGTTGRPKGVVATHANVAFYIRAARAMYGFRPGDVFTSIARATFSISLFDLVSPLTCGGAVRILDRAEILDPERLSRRLDEVTVMHAGPSLLASLFRHLRAHAAGGRTFPRMRHASTGGDLVPPSVMTEMTRVFANAEIFVIYGCTEISCMGTTFPVPRGAPLTKSFVGKAFPGVAVRVVDEREEVVPYGVVGEIAFAGRRGARRADRCDDGRRALTHERRLDAEVLRDLGDLGDHVLRAALRSTPARKEE